MLVLIELLLYDSAFAQETEVTELVFVMQRKQPRSKWFKVYVNAFHVNA